MKKLILFILGFVLTVGLVACGYEDGTTGSPTTTTGDHVEDEQPTDEVTVPLTEAESEDNGRPDRILEGTVVALLEDEILFVEQLNLSEEELRKTADEWFTNDNVYRLVGIETDVEVGTEIRISIAITTMSLPPLAPVISYEIIN